MPDRRYRYTGYLIDPAKRTVTLTELTDLESYYKALDCSMIERAGYFDNSDELIVDEEGLLTLQNPMDAFWFVVPEANRQPVTGRGVIVGSLCDEWCSPKMKIEEALDKVHFITASLAREIFAELQSTKLAKPPEGTFQIDMRYNPFQGAKG